MSCIRYASGYAYQLRAPYTIKLPEIRPAHGAGTEWITLDLDGTLTIRAGYAWDGASGPTIDSKSSMRASLVHDALSQLMRLGLLSRDFRKDADLAFRRICLNDGMWSIRAQLWYMAVRVFAERSTLPEGEPQDEYAGCGCDQP